LVRVDRKGIVERGHPGLAAGVPFLHLPMPRVAGNAAGPGQRKEMSSMFYQKVNRRSREAMTGFLARHYRNSKRT